MIGVSERWWAVVVAAITCMVLMTDLAPRLSRAGLLSADMAATLPGAFEVAVLSAALVFLVYVARRG